ncbi:protein S40-7-like [Cornus florida]|uniref:protein S40-7-like n=1 Tax=Cornus florida TaxID=4283 RepID=UPI0028A11C01|nr:protein S40-7-like [Cornus florida]
MDLSGAASRFRIEKTTSHDRFLGVFTHSRLVTDVSGSGEELNEDDIFWNGDLADNNHFSTVPSTSADRNHHNHAKGYSRAENFGILAALPVSESDQSLQTRSVFNHKASVSSSSSSSTSSSRMIPTMPKKPPLDRQSSVKYQSAPMNVPVLSDAMRRNRAIREFDDIDDDDNEGDFEMLPPHEMVASKHSPMVSCSVLEGVGRTLKGRDLRQVRNAVWRKTGFLD